MNLNPTTPTESLAAFGPKNLKNIILLTLGYFVFSTSGDSALRNLGLSYNLQEFWLILLFPILKPFHYKNACVILRSQIFLTGIILLTLFSLIPVLSGYSAHDVFRTTRPIFYILFLSLYFSRYPQDISIFNIFFICIGAILGDLHAAFSARFIKSITGGQFLYGANVTAIFAAASCITLKGSYKSSSIYILATFSLIVISSFRINLLAVFLGISLSMILMLHMNANISKFFNTLIRLLAISFGFITVFYLYLGTLATKFVIYRLVDRTQRLFTAGLKASEDDIRSNTIFRYFDSIDLSNIWPQGFITVAKRKIGIHYDFPISFFIDTFGLLIAILIFLFIVTVIISAVLNLKNTRTFNAMTVASLYMVFFPLLLLVHGRFFYVFSEAMIFGILLGLAISTHNTHFKNFTGSSFLGKHT